MLMEGICFCSFSCFQPIPVVILLQGSQLPSFEGYLEEHIWPMGDGASRKRETAVLGGHRFDLETGSGCPFE